MSENDILSELKYDNSVKSKLGWERWLMFECQTIDRAATEIERLRADLLEQAHLLFLSGEREARLLARVEALEAVLHAIFPDGANIKLVPKANAEEAKP
jgi:hypothetical protein